MQSAEGTTTCTHIKYFDSYKSRNTYMLCRSVRLTDSSGIQYAEGQ
jgi:hypothetical protein